MLKQAFDEIIGHIDKNARVGALGGVGGDELMMPLNAADGRVLSWNKWARDVS
jgi:hypothetical protein